jgi:type IV secretory pathway ATPase VirB11/archaellum biosynthesis ATPase
MKTGREITIHAGSPENIIIRVEDNFLIRKTSTKIDTNNEIPKDE